VSTALHGRTDEGFASPAREPGIEIVIPGEPCAQEDLT
jgi:hypothetical protein